MTDIKMIDAQVTETEVGESEEVVKNGMKDFNSKRIRCCSDMV
jgi:hypothetical protein